MNKEDKVIEMPLRSFKEEHFERLYFSDMKAYINKIEKEIEQEIKSLPAEERLKKEAERIIKECESNYLQDKRIPSIQRVEDFQRASIAAEIIAQEGPMALIVDSGKDGKGKIQLRFKHVVSVEKVPQMITDALSFLLKNCNSVYVNLLEDQQVIEIVFGFTMY